MDAGHIALRAIGIFAAVVAGTAVIWFVVWAVVKLVWRSGDTWGPPGRARGKRW
jgi:hypothetical protein